MGFARRGGEGRGLWRPVAAHRDWDVRDLDAVERTDGIEVWVGDRVQCLSAPM